jgi:hypothetical protein
MSGDPLASKDEHQYQLSKVIFDRTAFSKRSTLNQQKFPGNLDNLRSNLSCSSLGKDIKQKQPTLVLLKCSEESLSKFEENKTKLGNRQAGSISTDFDKRRPRKQSPVASFLRLVGISPRKFSPPTQPASNQGGSSKSVRMMHLKVTNSVNSKPIDGRQVPYLPTELSGHSKQSISPTDTKCPSPVHCHPFMMKKKPKKFPGPKVDISIKLAPKLCLDDSILANQPTKILLGPPEAAHTPIVKLQDTAGLGISSDILRKDGKSSVVIRSASHTSSCKQIDSGHSENPQLGDPSTLKTSTFKFRTIKSKQLTKTESNEFSEGLARNEDDDSCN